MNSWCSRCALLTSAMVGCAMRASSAISPGWFMPSSTTPARCQHVWSWRRRNSVSGTPMWLLRLPSVAKAPSPSQARRIAAIICVTVVLPLLPVTAMSGRSKRARQPVASRCSASRLSATSRPGQASTVARPGRARPAPPQPPWPGRLASMSWPSKRSPFSATNRSPARSVRVSLCTRVIGVAPSPTSVEPGSSAWAWASVIMHADLLLANACSASATSENGCLTPAISW